VEQITQIVVVALMMIGMASTLGGVPSAFLIFLLRMNRPERRAGAWSALLIVAGVWSVIAAALGAWLIHRFIVAEGMEGPALLSIHYPLWLIVFGPAGPVLITLWMYRPATTEASFRSLDR
jgi:hypothetical protein